MKLKMAILAVLAIMVMGCLAPTGPTPGPTLTMIAVPAGTFQRNGTPGDTCQVSAFYMSQTEITVEQFTAVTGYANPSDQFTTVVNGPVQKVNWYHAITFCNKLSLKEGLSPVYSVSVGGVPVNFNSLAYASIPQSDNADWNAVTIAWGNNGYRLPTEMEWEWAAMGATSDRSNGYTGTGVNSTGYGKGYAGSSEAGQNQVNLDNYYWNSANSGVSTHPVGGKLANELGLFDMNGNVWEWCNDWYDNYPVGALTDYTGSASGSARIIRGRSFYEAVSTMPITSRGNYNPDAQYANVGFRVVRR